MVRAVCLSIFLRMSYLCHDWFIVNKKYGDVATMLPLLLSDPPSAPRNFRVLETYKDYIVVSWEPPEHDGGAKVMQYIVEKRDATRGSGMFVIAGTIDASESQYKVTKLFQGNAYQFRVSAENRVGPGPPAEIVEPTVAKLPYGKWRMVRDDASQQYLM